MISKPVITLVAALGPDGVIGRKGELIYHLSSDMKYFKTITMGKPVVMGRRTYESIPEKFRPLSGRTNIVLTHNKAWKAEGVKVIHNINEMFDAAGNVPEIIIAGGAEIYNMTLPIADKLCITDISYKVDFLKNYMKFDSKTKEVSYIKPKNEKQKTDVYFPILPWESSEWNEVSSIRAPETEFDVFWRNL